MRNTLYLLKLINNLKLNFMTKRTTTIILTIGLMFISSIQVFSQNLVPNPSFEIQDTCPAVSEIWLAPPWQSASLGTPDLFNSTCSSQNSSARTGIGSSGVYCYNTFADNREYIEAPLTTPLTAGQTYCVTFYVKRSNFRYATNRIGAYFSTTEIDETSTSVLPFVPQVENNPANAITSSTSWTEVSGEFTAAGGEAYILIGSFASDAETDTTVANSASSSKVAYYKIDDVSVTACIAGIDENNQSNFNALIYPSPANSSVTVKNNSNAVIKHIKILDLSGKLVAQESINLLIEQETHLDVSYLEDGSYLVVLEGDTDSSIQRIVISH